MAKEVKTPHYNEAEFQEALVSYADGKDEEKVLKSKLDLLNNGIKFYMNAHDKTELSYKDVTVTLRQTETIKYNEVMLLEYLKSKGFTNCIKTKEYVDMNELEKYIYAGAVDTAELDKFKDRDFKQALYYKRSEA